LRIACGPALRITWGSALFDLRFALILGPEEKTMSELTANQISDFSFAVNPEAAASIHDDGIVILHTGKGCIYSSNGTGARVWRCVERRLSLEAIANEISGAYQIARTTAREHAVRFLAELERHMLIERRAES
jgi:UDP-N-acetylglucosamine transferase subunit ALG13